MAHRLYQKGLSIVGAKRHDAFCKMSARISARSLAYPLLGAGLFGTAEGLRNIHIQHQRRDRGQVPAYIPVDYDYAARAAGKGALKGLLIGNVANIAPLRIGTATVAGLLVGGGAAAYDAYTDPLP